MGTKTVEIKQNAIVFGIKITESEKDPEKRITYTDDAQGRLPVATNKSVSDSTNYNGWKDTWIFNKVYPVMLSAYGSVAYKLDPDDQTKAVGGASSDISNISYNGNAMVCVEKFYIKFSMSGNDELIQICNKQLTGYQPIGFIKENSTEANAVYLPMFMGSYDSSNKLRSISGQNIKFLIEYNEAREAAKKNGSGYDIETFALNQMFQTLYLILMKNCNYRTALGTGRSYTNAKTGILTKKGAIACDYGTKTTKFLWIEDYTSNSSNGIYRFETGIFNRASDAYVKMQPPYDTLDQYNYSMVSPYKEAPDTNTIDISSMGCRNEFGRYAVAYNGTETTYECAKWEYDFTNAAYISLRSSKFGIAGKGWRRPDVFSDNNSGAALSYVPK